MNESPPDVVLLERLISAAELVDPALRDAVREITFLLVGQGEPL